MPPAAAARGRGHATASRAARAWRVAAAMPGTATADSAAPSLRAHPDDGRTVRERYPGTLGWELQQATLALHRWRAARRAADGHAQAAPGLLHHPGRKWVLALRTGRSAPAAH